MADHTTEDVGGGRVAYLINGVKKFTIHYDDSEEQQQERADGIAAWERKDEKTD